jgi:PAS domain-containing protein
VCDARARALARACSVDFSIFESLMDGFVAIDEDGVVLAFNSAAEKMVRVL